MLQANVNETAGTGGPIHVHELPDSRAPEGLFTTVAFDQDALDGTDQAFVNFERNAVLDLLDPM